jgi:hypothetical protein
MANGSFDPGLAAQLAQLCELTYVQYLEGLEGGDGSIKPPPGFQQTASFSAPEVDLTRKSPQLAAALAPQFDVADAAARQALAAGLRTVFFGFTLQPSPGTAGGYHLPRRQPVRRGADPAAESARRLPVHPGGGRGGRVVLLFQTNDVGDNHGILGNYIPAVMVGVETNAPRQYPNSGIPG